MLFLTVNGKPHEVAAEADIPLLWVLRDELGLKGTKYGCGAGICGTCTVHLDGAPVRACVTLLSDVAGKNVVTIEGLARDLAHPVVRAWLAERVPQCGYCQPGMIMAAAALLSRKSHPSDADIDESMGGMLCRCGTYQRVRRAIHRAAAGAEVGGPELEGATLFLEPTGIIDAVFEPSPWLRITEDGTVIVVVDRSEMGQGVATSLAVLVAEELEADLSQIRIEFAPADSVYTNPALGRQVTGGSTSVRAAWVPLRRAGAIAREMLVAAAAETWGVDRGTCRAEGGAVIHKPSGRKLDYGALAAKAATQPVPLKVDLKDPRSFRLIGTALPRLSHPTHVTGRSIFGIDVVVPGQWVATVLRPPTPGGRVMRWDGKRAEAWPGVQAVVPTDTRIAVIANEFWSAVQGRDALDVTWEEGALAGLDSDKIRQRLEDGGRQRGSVFRDEGDIEAAFAEAVTTLEAIYDTPYLAHATMEPMNCTAHVSEGRCEVWTPTQNQTAAREVAAEAAELPEEAVTIHTTFLGGGFGRRLRQDFVAEAVEIAKAVGHPVQVVWTREDDMRHDFYRPTSLTVFKAAIDSRGSPSAWFQRIVGPSLAFDGVDVPYRIPSIREEHVEVDPGIPTGPWRSVGSSQNAFTIEGFVDELAHVAGEDPLAYRLRLLADAPRHRGVLKLAADKAGWGGPLPEGCFRGIAVYHSFGSWVAQVAEIAVGDNGDVRVRKVVCAIDCGTPVDPDGIVAQIEGAVAFGLTAALKGEITIAEGRIVQSNFHDYPLLTIAEMPEGEVHIVPSDKVYGGVGEPGVPPIAPAVTNAVFAATGKRIRRLPIRAESLR